MIVFARVLVSNNQIYNLNALWLQMLLHCYTGLPNLIFTRIIALSFLIKLIEICYVRSFKLEAFVYAIYTHSKQCKQESEFKNYVLVYRISSKLFAFLLPLRNSYTVTAVWSGHFSSRCSTQSRPISSWNSITPLDLSTLCITTIHLRLQTD
jgi:hypothetical protein